MTVRSCPDWPDLLERAPDLLFKHYTVLEAQLPAETHARLVDVPLDGAEVCCDREKHVFNPEHTDPRVAEALRETHWFDLREWIARGPGSAA